DGKYVVYSGGGDLTAADLPSIYGRFWLRRLDALEPRRLSDVEGAVPLFFWSPDSQYVGYCVGSAIVVRDVAGTAPRIVADLHAAPQGVAWGKDGQLIVALPRGIYRMSAKGGAPTLVLRSEPG